MIPCAHTLATPEHELLSAIELFATLGFEAVEILIDDGYPCAITPFATAARLGRVRTHLDGVGLLCAHVTPYVRTLDALATEARRGAIGAMEDAIRIAAALGATGVRVLAGRREGERLDERRRAFVASMRALSRTASASGVSLNIETKGWSFASDGATMLELLSEIDEPAVGILLDPANATIDGGDPTSDLDGQLPHVRHVHFKDVRRGPGNVWNVCRAGDGSVPWPRIADSLRRSGYEGAVCAEYERRWHPDLLPPASEGLQHELAAVRALSGPPPTNSSWCTA